MFYLNFQDHHNCVIETHEHNQQDNQYFSSTFVQHITTFDLVLDRRPQQRTKLVFQFSPFTFAESKDKGSLKVGPVQGGGGVLERGALM